jgi:hypothetical protein
VWLIGFIDPHWLHSSLIWISSSRWILFLLINRLIPSSRAPKRKLLSLVVLECDVLLLNDLVPRGLTVASPVLITLLHPTRSVIVWLIYGTLELFLDGLLELVMWRGFNMAVMVRDSGCCGRRLIQAFYCTHLQRVVGLVGRVLFCTSWLVVGGCLLKRGYWPTFWLGWG